MTVPLDAADVLAVHLTYFFLQHFDPALELEVIYPGLKGVLIMNAGPYLC